MTDTLLLRLVGGAFLLVGGVIAFFLARQLARAVRSLGWLAVEGVIQQAGAKDVYVEEAGDARARGFSSTQVAYEYAYEVDGKRYVSRRVTFSDNVVKTSGALQKIFDAHRRGDAVTVYYNPKQPSEAVLKRGPSAWNITPFITPGLMIAIGLAGTFFAEELLARLS